MTNKCTFIAQNTRALSFMKTKRFPIMAERVNTKQVFYDNEK